MGDSAAVDGTAAAEFHARVILQAAGEVAGEKRARITVKHLQTALGSDSELQALSRKINLFASTVTSAILPNDLKTNKEHQKARKKRKRDEAKAAAAASGDTTAGDGDGDDDDESSSSVPPKKAAKKKSPAKKAGADGAEKKKSPAKKTSAEAASKK